MKPLQALAVLESGAGHAFALRDEEVALACASHAGEPAHTDAIGAWLARLGLAPQDLACGAHPPLDARAAAALVRAGEEPSPLHNNCSGKHAGMLTLARHLGASSKGYTAPDHPVQERIGAVLAEMAGLADLPAPAIDGCGVPTWPMPLRSLARAMAGLGAPDALSPARAAACRRVQRAMRAHPHLVAGTGRACTAILTAVPEVVVKSGAEGVYMAALPQLRLGLALKIEDGAGRAAPVALLALFQALGLLDDQARAELSDLARPLLRNSAGVLVGGIEPAPGWPDVPG